MPAITEAMEENLFEGDEKRHVVEKIVRETSTSRPARGIVRQERGMKKLQREGIDVQIASNQVLKEMLDLSQKYHDKLRSLQYAKFDHLDPRLVIALVGLFQGVHGILEDILQSVAAARGQA
jgi:hypothetical protein